jgi:phospholipid/cholesterol/gamma-HCH transport system substrate-binding protein
MKEATRNFLVGLFVLFFLGALASLMVMLGETPRWLGSGDWELSITGAEDIRGVGEGSPVYLNGVEIGRIARLEFVNPEFMGLGVNIVARIKQHYGVPRESRAKIYGATLGLGTGQVLISVDTRTSAQYVPRDGTGAIAGESASAFGEIVSPELTRSLQRVVENIADFAEAARPVADNLALLLEERTIAQVDHGTTTANAATAIERIDRLVRNLNSILGDDKVQEDVKQVATTLKDSAEDIKQLITLWNTETRRLADNINEGVDRTEQHLDEAFTRLESAAGKLDRAASDLASILHGVAQGEGTAGMLLRDPRLYEAGVLAFERLAEVLAIVERITGKIDREGRFTIAQETSVGTFSKDLPLQREPVAGP